MPAPPRCRDCLFCEDVLDGAVYCSSADLAQDCGWEAYYLEQGFLVLPPDDARLQTCFWYVAKR